VIIEQLNKLRRRGRQPSKNELKSWKRRLKNLVSRPLPLDAICVLLIAGFPSPPFVLAEALGGFLAQLRGAKLKKVGPEEVAKVQPLFSLLISHSLIPNPTAKGGAPSTSIG